MDINTDLFVSNDQIQKTFDLKELKIKMSSVMSPFLNAAVELCVVTINERPWTHAREVCKALEYGKATKAADVVRHLCSKTDYAHKWQLTGLVPADRPKNSQKCDIYISEEGMYEIVFSSQQPKAKDFRRHYCNVLFPHVRQQLTNKMNKDHQQVIEEKDAAITSFNDDLKFVNMIMWHCKHKGMYIRTSYKNVKTSLPILRHVMFLMQKIQAKTTLL